MLEYLFKASFFPIRFVVKTFVRRVCFFGKPKIVIAGLVDVLLLFYTCVARSYLSSLNLILPQVLEKYLAPLLIEYVEDLRSIDFFCTSY